MYALAGGVGIEDRNRMSYIPANPAVIFTLTKFFDDSGQRCSNDGLSELIGREGGDHGKNKYLVQSGQRNASHETRQDDPEAIIRENMLFCCFPGGASLWFLVGRLRGCWIDTLRGKRHQYSRLAGTTGSELTVRAVQQLTRRASTSKHSRDRVFIGSDSYGCCLQ